MGTRVQVPARRISSAGRCAVIPKSRCAEVSLTADRMSLSNSLLFGNVTLCLKSSSCHNQKAAYNWRDFTQMSKVRTIKSIFGTSHLWKYLDRNQRSFFFNHDMNLQTEPYRGEQQHLLLAHYHTLKSNSLILHNMIVAKEK